MGHPGKRYGRRQDVRQEAGSRKQTTGQEGRVGGRKHGRKVLLDSNRRMLIFCVFSLNPLKAV